LILLSLYILNLIFSLKTHSHLFNEEEGESHEEVLEWSVGKSVVILLIATAFVGVMAEFLLHALEHSVKDLGLSVAFVGVIIVALIGNAAEHSTAVVVALKNKMNLSFTIAVESSKQIALFVAPVLVLLGLWFGPNAKGEWMNLDFGLMEVAGVLLSVMIVSNISHDGESNWLEGAMLLGVYAILAAGFFFLP
jgi:Ca2+:H+ antiporter